MQTESATRDYTDAAGRPSPPPRSDPAGSAAARRTGSLISRSDSRQHLTTRNLIIVHEMAGTACIVGDRWVCSRLEARGSMLRCTMAARSQRDVTWLHPAGARARIKE